MAPWNGFECFKLALNASQLTLPRLSVLPSALIDGPVHTHLFSFPVCVCVCVCSHLHNAALARRPWLCFQIRTIRDYITVWRGAGLVEFSARKGRAAAASGAQQESLLISPSPQTPTSTICDVWPVQRLLWERVNTRCFQTRHGQIERRQEWKSLKEKMSTFGKYTQTLSLLSHLHLLRVI